AVSHQPGVEEVRHLVDALVRGADERREDTEMPFFLRIAPAQDRLIAQGVEAVASLHGLTRPACQARVEDLGAAAVEVRPAFQVAGQTRSVLAVIAAEAELADNERRAAQGEIDTVTVALFHPRVAVVAADHRVERLDRLELDPRSPGRQRVAEGPRRVQEDAQRHQVKGDRRERLEVLGAREFFAVDAVDGQAPEADAQPVVEQRLRVSLTFAVIPKLRLSAVRCGCGLSGRGEGPAGWYPGC